MALLLAWNLIHNKCHPAPWMISFTRASFSLWERVNERKVLMKRSGGVGSDCPPTLRVWMEAFAELCHRSHSAVVLFFSSRAIVERRTDFQQYLRWIQRGQMRIKHWSTLAESLLEDWTPVWKPLIYFSVSEGSMCWVHSRPTGSISLPGTNLK